MAMGASQLANDSSGKGGIEEPKAVQVTATGYPAAWSSSAHDQRGHQPIRFNASCFQLLMRNEWFPLTCMATVLNPLVFQPVDRGV